MAEPASVLGDLQTPPPQGSNLLARAWGILPVRAFVLALAATLLVWGRFLSGGVTLSPEAQVPSVHFGCRVAGPRLDCAKPGIAVQIADAGAPAWQEMPVDYLLRRARLDGQPRPRWNPWVGSGYPLALDGINASTSPTRWFLSWFPGDQGRDVLVFARFLAWTFGIVLAAGLFGAGTAALAVAAFAATLAPYPATLVDMVFLDLDLLGPWFLVALLALMTGRVRLGVAVAGAAALGLTMGALGFLQAQLVLCVVIALVAAAAAPSTRGRSLLLAAAAGAGALAFAPSWLPTIRNLDQFVSSRDTQCLIDKGAGVSAFLARLLTPGQGQLYEGLATLSGLVLLPFVPRGLRFAVVAFVAIVAWTTFGLPSAMCAVPLVSGARFTRHLVPHAQMLFLVLVTAAAQGVAERAGRRVPLALLGATTAITAAIALLGKPPGAERLLALSGLAVGLGAAGWAVRRAWTSPRAEQIRQGAVAAGLVLAAVSPFLLGAMFTPYLIDGSAGAPEVAPLPERIDPTTPLGAVHELAHQEDRRHYATATAPGSWRATLYPNWSAALEIPSLLYLGPLYPAWYHELNATLYGEWPRDPQHVIVPDRFVPVSSGEAMSVPFQRVLAVHRVSLLTFPVGSVRFGEVGSPYAESRCRFLSRSFQQFLESWVCPSVGGIGWFPRSIGVVRTRSQALATLGRLSPAEIAETALLGPELDPALEARSARGIGAGAGRVVSFERRGDDLSYVLDVERAGPFAIADTWFRGWTASVNGRPAPISRANVAFKAVLVPQGRVELKLHFAPSW